MATDIRLKEELPAITEQLVETYTECSRINHLAHEPLPNRDAVADIVARPLEVLYPGYGKRQNLHIGNIGYYVGSLIDALHDKLTDADRPALCATSCAKSRRTSTARRSPSRRRSNCSAGCRRSARCSNRTWTPRSAATRPRSSHHEIIFCYPGLEAITVYRVAHELYAARRAVHPADDDRVRPRARPASTSTPARPSGRASSSTTAPAS